MTELRHPARLAATESTGYANPTEGASRSVHGGTPVVINSPAALAQFSRALPRQPESAGLARKLVTSSLETWGMEPLVGAAHLVVTELVANAVRHAEQAMVLVTVTRRAEQVVRVAVADRSEALPVLRSAAPDALDGRGLALVAALSEGRWGVERMRWGDCTGKTVWADLETATVGEVCGRVPR